MSLVTYKWGWGMGGKSVAFWGFSIRAAVLNPFVPRTITGPEPRGVVMGEPTMLFSAQSSYRCMEAMAYIPSFAVHGLRQGVHVPKATGVVARGGGRPVVCHGAAYGEVSGGGGREANVVRGGAAQKAAQAGRSSKSLKR